MSTNVIEQTNTASIQEILEFGKKVARGDLQVVPTGLQAGALISQGDINFTKLPGIPKNVTSYRTAVEKAAIDLQLAEGNTKGSRHILRDLDNANLHVLKNPNSLQGRGYIIEVLGETIVEHPEHGDLLFRDGTWIVTHQRAYAEDLRRAAD